MSAVERLSVKLSTVRHVRDTSYWKLPYGSVIIPHPRLLDLDQAPLRTKALGAAQSWTKVGYDAWKGDKTGQVVRSNHLVGGLSKMALPPGVSKANYGLAGRKRVEAKNAAKRFEERAWKIRNYADTQLKKFVDNPKNPARERDVAKAEMANRLARKEALAKSAKVLADHAAKQGPLTDAEFAEHVDAVALTVSNNMHLATDRHYSGFNGVWDPKRAKIHKEIVKQLLAKYSSAKADRKMLITGGLPGAGKSGTLGKIDLNLDDYLMASPDDVKEELAKRGMVPDVPGLLPMELAPLVHVESNDITNMLVRAAEKQGLNIIQDISMSNSQTVDRREREAHQAGYKVHALFVDIPVETSVDRALSRYRSGMEKRRGTGEGPGGRWMPPSAIRRAAGDPQYGSVNRRAFEDTKHHFDGWQLWDNGGEWNLHLVDSGGEWDL